MFNSKIIHLLGNQTYSMSLLIPFHIIKMISAHVSILVQQVIIMLTPQQRGENFPHSNHFLHQELKKTAGNIP